MSPFSSSINAPVLRFADVVLIYAEAAANIGLDGDAFDALDMIRNRARNSGILDIDNVSLLPSAGTAPLAVDRTLSGDLLLDEIMWDRAKELVYEGTSRFDVIRLGEVKFLEEVKGQMWDTDLSKDTNPLKPYPWPDIIEAKHVLFPIPEAEMRGNKLIGENNY